MRPTPFTRHLVPLLILLLLNVLTCASAADGENCAAKDGDADIVEDGAADGKSCGCGEKPSRDEMGRSAPVQLDSLEAEEAVSQPLPPVAIEMATIPAGKLLMVSVHCSQAGARHPLMCSTCCLCSLPCHVMCSLCLLLKKFNGICVDPCLLLLSVYL